MTIGVEITTDFKADKIDNDDGTVKFCTKSVKTNFEFNNSQDAFDFTMECMKAENSYLIDVYDNSTGEILYTYVNEKALQKRGMIHV